ncbi:hypothetical protein DCC62_17135 [candidate division KSB1 bacterium]|nr:MAG: hypothetical protein DCC62_17135 [candidate division KSB1 bacterium]
MGEAPRNVLPAEGRNRGTSGEIGQAKKHGIHDRDLLYSRKRMFAKDRRLNNFPNLQPRIDANHRELKSISGHSR